MANPFQNAGGSQEPSPSAPLYTSRIFTGWYTNRSPLRDGVTTHAAEKAGYGRQDAILSGTNMEITPRLTLGRRAGTTAWGAANPYQRINRFYSFNTFTLTTEVIRVMVDEAGAVYDTLDGSQKNLVFTKSPGASSTYFLGVGNTLFMANGVDNTQWVYNPTTGTGTIYPWGVTAPTQAPSASIPPAAMYGQWQSKVVFQRSEATGQNSVHLVANTVPASVQYASPLGGTTGTGEPAWLPNPGDVTVDGSVNWHNGGDGQWVANHSYGVGVGVTIFVTASDAKQYFYQNLGNGPTGATLPNFLTGINSITQDNGYQWVNIGRVLNWPDIGATTLVGTQAPIQDATGNIQRPIQAGKTGTAPPLFSQVGGGFTSDPTGLPQGAVLWQNVGSGGTVQYGFAYMNSVTKDISSMSPASVPMSTGNGQLVQVTGQGSTQAGVDTIILYRTEHGGSTFFYDTQFPFTGGGQWSYDDTTLDADLNIFWQAQRAGEGTPLESGATCLAYHLGRIFAAVGNVVWASAGPDAIVGGSSGNAGFAISFTCQSKVIRLWPTSIGLIVFTVRDAYIILGNGIDVSLQGGTGLYIKVWVENLPLLNYDAFTTFGTTAFLFTGKNMVISLDPGAGIVEVSQPIADVLESVSPQTAYLTYHSHTSRDTALYLGNAQDTWYRLSPSIAPEAGFAWSLPALPAMGMSALQSVEVTPGVYQLLMGPKVNGGRIFYRDTSTRTDGGTAYPAYSDFGVITLASPGQLAGIAWMNLEAINSQNEPKLMMLLGELYASVANPLERVKRTRHDPVNLPESTTLDSTRYTFLRGGSPIWCRHLIFRVDYGTSSTFDELLSFTIFGSTYQEFAA